MPVIQLQPVSHEITQIPYWDVERVWSTALPMIQKVIDVQDEWTAEAVYNRLIIPNSDTQLWLSQKFALITQVQNNFTGVRKVLLFLCGGEDVDSIQDAQSKVEDWALRYLGVPQNDGTRKVKLMISGRKGWLRVLKGFKETNTVMEKELCKPSQAQ